MFSQLNKRNIHQHVTLFSSKNVTTNYYCYYYYY